MKLALVRLPHSCHTISRTTTYKFQDVTTRGSYYPDKSLATAAVCVHILMGGLSNSGQNPPLYLHVTSTSKAGLEKAIQKIEELMKQELPNLVDERRFRRRDQDTVERDEFGRVSISVFQSEPRLTVTA